MKQLVREKGPRRRLTLDRSKRNTQQSTQPFATEALERKSGPIPCEDDGSLNQSTESSVIEIAESPRPDDAAVGTPLNDTTPWLWFPRSVHVSILESFGGAFKGATTSSFRLHHPSSMSSMVQTSCLRHLHYSSHNDGSKSKGHMDDSSTLDLFLNKDISSAIVRGGFNPHEIAKQLIRADNHDAAIVLGKQLLKGVLDSSDTATMASQLAILCLATGQNDAALGYSELAVQNLPQSSSKPTPAQALRTVEVLSDHGLVQLARNRIEAAICAWREAAHIAIAVQGYHGTTLAVLLHNMGVWHWHVRDYAESIRSFEYAAHVHRTVLSCHDITSPTTHSGTLEQTLYRLALTMNSLGLVQYYSARAVQRSHERTVSLLTEAQSLLTSIQGDTRHEQDRIAAFLQCVEDEVLTAKQGGHDETILDSSGEYSSGSHDVLDRSTESVGFDSRSDQDVSFVRCDTAIFGNSDGVPRPPQSSGLTFEPSDATGFWNLGLVTVDQTPEQCVHQAVLECFGRSRDLDKELEEEDDGDNGRGGCVIKVQRCNDDHAASLRTTNASSTKEMVDFDKEDALDADLQLSEIYSQVRDHVDARDSGSAVTILRRTLKNHRQKYGTGHHLIGTALHNIGLVLLLAKRYVKALVVLEKAAIVRSEALGPDHVDVHTTLLHVASAQLAVGQVRTAHDLLCDVRSKLACNGFYGHVLLCKVINNLGVAVAYETRALGEALALFQEAYTFQKRLLDSRFLEEQVGDTNFLLSLATAHTRSNMGYVFCKHGTLMDAMDCYRDAYNLMRRNLPSDDARVVDAKRNLDHVSSLLKSTGSMEHEQSFDSSSCLEANKGCFCST